MKRILIVLTILACFIYTTCDIALGVKINMLGPVVNITGPEPNRSIGETDPLVSSVFELVGTIESPSKIKEATVKIEHWNGKAIVKMGREFKWDGSWKTRESADDDWKTYERSAYEVEDPNNLIGAPSWVAETTKVTYSLPIFMTRMESGEYFIEVKAWDNAGLHDSNSSKKLKIKFVNVAPKLEIRTGGPKLFISEGANLAHPKAPSYDHLIFDPFGKPNETYDNIKDFTNSFSGLSWRIERGKSGIDAEKITFIITNEHNLDTLEGRVVYLQWSFDNNTYPTTPQSGTHSGTDPKFPVFTLDTDLEKALPRDSVTPLQLISIIEDAAHNIEYKSNGWFFYLPYSDKPYTDISFATQVKQGETPDANVCEARRMFRGSRDNFGVAYDDDGIKSINYTVYRLPSGGGFTHEQTYGPYTIDKNSDPGITEGLTKLNWTFIATRAWGTGRFKIDVTVTDINNKTGDTYTAYFSIDSNSTPSLDKWVTPEIVNRTTYWGDTSGEFTLSGKAQIECSDDCTAAPTNKEGHSLYVSGVTIVWMNPNDTSDDNVTRYNMANDPLWDSEGIDDKGNKRFFVPASNITFDTTTQQNKNDLSQESWNFFLTKNWFTDIGINTIDPVTQQKIKFENQVFKVRFMSSGGIAGVHQGVTVIGDSTAPILTPTHIEFYNNNTTTQIALSGNLFPEIGEGMTVKIIGTWSDDSIGKWSARGNNRHNDLLGTLSVEWKGELNKFHLVNPVLKLDAAAGASGGTFETDAYTFSAKNTDPFVTIEAKLADLTGNPGLGSFLQAIECEYPILTRISSTVSDGVYGNYKDTYPDTAGTQNYIDIFLDFNKNIYFHGSITGQPQGNAPTQATSPYLQLNNGGRAYYFGGNRTSRVTFRYFIDNNHSSLGTASSASSTSTNKLNVIGINFMGYPKEQWFSVQSEENAIKDAVFFSEDIYADINSENDSDKRSLFKQKNIRIDKLYPVIIGTTGVENGNGITSSTANERPHGVGSQIRITVTFNEDIKVDSAANAGNLYLNLGALGNAGFDSAGARTVNFMYTVLANQNSNGIVAQSLTGTTYIKDIAGNQVSSGPETAPAATINYSSANLGKGLKVETRAPNSPKITDTAGVTLAANTTHYGDVSFVIETNPNASYNSSIQTVEYCLNYSSAPGANNEWLTYQKTIPTTGDNANKTDPIPITINGTYNIAARVWDNATTQNMSSPTQVANVTVNKGHVLQRITSSSPDGIYGHPDKKEIYITLEFRVPVKLTGSPASNVTLTMGGVTGATNKAFLQAPDAGNDVKKWTFKYEIDQNASSDRLAVTSLDFGSGVDITDVANNNIRSSVTVAGVSASNKFEVQKDIQILSGRPSITTKPSGAIVSGAATPATDMMFTANGAALNMTFNRDIYRGNAKSKLIVRQIANGFRIPSVLTSDRYTQIFSGRGDIFSGDHADLTFGSLNSAALWADLGAILYAQGSNGATESGGKLTPDTTTKYVLKYDVNTDLADGTTVPGTSYTMVQIRTVFRAAEALSFGVNDPEVKINNVSSRPRQLQINFSERSGLPVKGAVYELIIPNGFVKDILGKGNGDIGAGGSEADPKGKDENISSTSISGGSGVRVLSLTGTEVPVIRINKENDTFTGYINGSSDNNRNITQPLKTSFKIDGRTPNSTFTYLTRETKDNVYTLANRNGNASGANDGSDTNGTSNLRLPNTGANNSFANFQLTRLRPQSGVNGVSTTSPVNGQDWTGAGLNYFTAMPTAWTGTEAAYTGATDIGTDNYNDGGMEINIRATVSGTSVYGYESAFRSVFVFNNQNGVLGGNANANNGTDGNFNNMSALARIWIRGGNTTQGDPNIPNFPISRDPTKWKKVKLMSPIDGANFTASTSEVGNDKVISDGTLDQRRRVWFWVTWGVNVTTFIDLHTGDLYDGTGTSYNDYPAPRADIRQYFMAWIPSKEHYALFPGRTTIVESRNKYGTFHDGGHGNLTLTSGKAPAIPTDMP